MYQRWTYRCYPTPEQETILARTFGCVRFVYNWGLAARTKAFKDGTRMNYSQSSAALTVLKQQPETVWLNEVSSVPLQQSLRDLQTAFGNFFAKRSKYPNFKKKNSSSTAEYTKSGFAFTDGNRLSIAKLGVLRVKWNRNLPSAPSSVRVIREATGHYYVSFVTEVEVAQLPKTGNEVGIDFGTHRLAALSTGELIRNPKHSYKRAQKMALLQRRAARKAKGSNRHKKAIRAVARCHAKIADARKDNLNKFTTRMVKEFDVIHIEDLNLRGMVKNHSLARAMSDASVGFAIQLLEQKAEMYGKKVIRIDRWFPSSKMCSDCGYVNTKVVLGVETWTCPSCGTFHDRDLNAAKNILAVGQTVAVHGDGVRATCPSGQEASYQ